MAIDRRSASRRGRAATRESWRRMPDGARSRGPARTRIVVTGFGAPCAVLLPGLSGGAGSDRKDLAVAHQFGRYQTDASFLGAVLSFLLVKRRLMSKRLIQQRLDRDRGAARRLVESGHAYEGYCAPERLKEERGRAEARGEAWKYDRACLQLGRARIAELRDGDRVIELHTH